MRADLHMHSVYSDGLYTPETLAWVGRMNGLQMMSITDHDNYQADERKRAAVEKEGLRYITGVELSAYEEKLKVHITGYCYDAKSPLCAKYQAEKTRLAFERMQDVLERLKRYKDIDLPKEEVLAQLQVDGIPVHTMHIVRALIKNGFYQDVQSTFKDLFSTKKPTYSFWGRATPEKAIEEIHSLGGFACIAHPGRISLPEEEKKKLIYRLKDFGVDGMECIYSTHTSEQTEYYKNMAKDLGLLITGGSDYHNEFQRRVVGMPAFEPSEELLDRLK